MPAKSKSSRQLAAILFADIVGYTTLMQKGEGKAMSILARYESVLQETVSAYNGEIIKKYGDGCLILFNSTVDAVQCALKIQLDLREDPIVPLRIGIHVGEVIHKGNDVFGNGVNIASRIESMGVAGAILFSKNAQEKIKNQETLQTKTLGSFAFKNVDEPIEIFALSNEGLAIPNSNEIKGKVKRQVDGANSSGVLMKLILGIIIIATGAFLYNQYGKSSGEVIEKRSKEIALSKVSNKSIAVLPLKNMSGQDNLEYVCDGMTDAIISRLSMISDMDKVSSMTSVLKYKNELKGLKEIAQELEVANILQGSFQKSGEQIKISLQLIDGASDNQLWTHTYTGEWNPDEIFGIQATITETIANKLNTQITPSEIASIQKMSTKSKEAYNLFLQAEYQTNKYNELAFSKAIPLYEQAIVIDSTFIEAYIGLANIWSAGGLVWGAYNEEEAWSKAKFNLFKALEIDSTKAIALSDLFGGSFYYDWNFDYCEPAFSNWLANNQMKHSERVEVDYANKTMRSKVALMLSEKMIEKFPTNGMSYFSKAEVLYYLDRKIETVEILKEADQLYSDNQFYVREAARYYYYLKEYDRFKSHLQILMNNFTDRAPIHLWMNAVNYQLENNTVEVENYLNQIRDKYNSHESGSPAWFMAMYYFSVDDVNNGFLWLERSFDRHEVEMTWLQREPLLQDVKDDPRYRSIHQKMGWPKILLN